ncbi:MAG TPA: RagB/SusD family nutrient uptake outer membrane protein [Bacteroides xylanisolvens]|uniref:RagB/SusD family nutrient uptake outer membrane protein n=1 Tax=Bacteroides xylanisolvens TaxID=371601 RepID=A0A921I3V7_9BACE|nr:RagB/SusD family nutrient uptake outer membrane protein [Bacteroides xylanisolvens]
MKSTKINIFFLSLFLGITLHSCLDLDPQDQLGGEAMWTSVEDYEQFANNFYSWTRDFKTILDGAHSDRRSDLIALESYDKYSHGSNTVLASDANYTNNYNNIRRTNLLLQNAESFSNPNDIAQYVGEAYFFRAYCYFDLLQLYGDAIITKTPLDIDSPEMNQKRNNRSEVVDLILEDLEHAIAKLPEFKNIGSVGYARISREGANAFLSRVALYEGTWQKFRGNVERAKALLDIAAKAAKKVIDSQQYQLFGTYAESAALGDSAQKYMFILEDVKSNPKGLTKKDNKEYILARCHDEVLSPIGTNITKGCLNNFFWITRKFANMYLCSNGLPIEYNGTTNEQFQGYGKKKSEFQNRDNRMKYTLLEPGVRYFSNAKSRVNWDDSDYSNSNNYEVYNPKIGTCYNNQKWCTERFVEDEKEGYDYPVIRYAEVLLNYAEAVYELYESEGRADEQAVTDALNISLNLVRRRVNPDMEKLTVEFVKKHGLDMRTEIRRERSIELFHEGFRLDDLKRWKTAETEMPQDLLGIKKTGTDYEAEKISYPTNLDGCIIVESGRSWAERNYLYPLPSDQLQLNSNLGQNPGWE